MSHNPDKIYTGLTLEMEARRYRELYHMEKKMGGWANFRHWVKSGPPKQNPAPSGKVLSDVERERLQFCRDEWAKNALHSTHLRRNYFWLIETLERLAEQKPVRGGGE